MLLSGDQIHRTTTACIEVGCIGLLLCIDRNQNPFSIYGAFKNALAVRQHNTAECAIIEGIGVFFSFCKLKAGFLSCRRNAAWGLQPVDE